MHQSRKASCYEVRDGRYSLGMVSKKSYKPGLWSDKSRVALGNLGGYFLGAAGGNPPHNWTGQVSIC